MKLGRGRPSKVNHLTIIDVILNHKETVLLPDLKIIKKSDPIWDVMSKDLNGDISPQSLYVFVTCNRYHIRDKLLQGRILEQSVNVSASDSIRSDPPIDSSAGICDVSLKEQDQECMTVALSIPRAKFNELVVDRLYKRKGKKNRVDHRQQKVLQPGKWQEVIASHIWNATKLKCGFNFKNHSLTSDAKFGFINGECNCGSTLRCAIQDVDDNDTNIHLQCIIKKGLGTCGKRYLRGPIREIVAKELLQKAVHVYRAEKADELMENGDPEPPHLYSSSVLSVAKNEYVCRQYLDPDPVKALAIMKATHLKDVIHSIGLDPFYVHYWTHYQTQTYRANSNCCLSIDATGSIVKKIEKPEKVYCKHIFLYQCVINCDDGQFSVSQMITESHHTNSIQFWLMEWVRSGAPVPREVVTDASRALMSAVIRTFTSCSTIEEYANACMNDNMPGCYVRMDVAHFIKIYASFLKTIPQRIKIFYLAAIGKLVVARDIDDARNIVKDILLTSRCETDGNLVCGRTSQCEQAKERIKALITDVSVDIRDSTTHREPDASNVCLSNLVNGITIECNDDEESVDNDIDVDGDKYVNGSVENQWSIWAENIDKEVRCAQKEIGDRDNAQYLPRLADRLVKDLKLIPLWSNIIRDKFGYGRVPASSAAVEGEFNKIKTHLLKYSTKPMRADVFLQKHVDYINGRIKIANAKSANRDIVSQDILLSPSGYAKETTHSENNSNGFTETVTVDLAENDINYNIPSSPLRLIQQTERSIDEETKEEETNLCPACAMHDPPSGAHKCTVCEVPVHALSQCSIPLDEAGEGYGERRLCIACSHTRSAPQILATREVEDWRGQGRSAKADKRKARYLGASAHLIRDKLVFEKNRQLPILKSGSTNRLQAIKIGVEKVCFYNTCVFDSLLQIMLSALSDWPSSKEKMEKLKENNVLINMALDTLEKGLRAQSYQMRGRILMDIHQSESDPIRGGCRLVNCASNVGSLARRLFRETPSFVENSTCDHGCRSREKPLAVPEIARSALRDKDTFDDVVTNHVRLPKNPSKCAFFDKCSGWETSSISALGDIVLLEFFELRNDDDHRQLSDIPQKFVSPISREIYRLVGFVNYSGPIARTRTSGIGHYTAICQRRETWVEYNDQCTKENILTINSKANPKLMVFIRTEDIHS